MKKWIILAALVCSACGKVQVAAPTTHSAEMVNSKGEAIGHVTFAEVAEGVQLDIQLRGVEPGERAIHIHEKGLCERPTFETAGPHYNPAGNEHGIENPKGPHAGDLPNIEADADGTVQLQFIATSFTLKEVKGRSIVLHEQADDYKTDPAGNSGPRIACGVIN